MKPVVKLPIGVEDFKKLRMEDFYYVDKTELITELLNTWSQVTLFTRPRRFGKSLNMNMLRTFFSYGCDPKLFDGLSVSRDSRLCEKYMRKFPVISITLKGVEAGNYEDAFAMLCVVIGQEALQFRFLLESERLSEEEKEQYARIIRVGSDQEPMFPMEINVLTSSLQTLSALLSKHYGQKVILLIDEYDVPLDKANQSGYYDEMTRLIRGLFGNALKTNEHLFFAVLTGCLRISKESIFTGLNNFKVRSITDPQFDQYFGFTDAEVKDMLSCYGLEEKYETVKEWYDGYRFGNTNVYCPWDVINYIDQARYEPEADPEAYWINSSGNAIIRTLLQKATNQTMKDLDRLVNGQSVTKKVCEELTYRELYDSIDNLWSILFTTGYLTKRQKTARNTYELIIPNQEIRLIFTEQILSWFQEEARRDVPALDAFCEAFSSNAESGEGYSDILIQIDSVSVGIVIELKYSESRDLEAACRQALRQIEEKNYTEQLREEDMATILKYGIACHRKACMVRMEGPAKLA